MSTTLLHYIAAQTSPARTRGPWCGRCCRRPRSGCWRAPAASTSSRNGSGRTCRCKTPPSTSRRTGPCSSVAYKSRGEDSGYSDESDQSTASASQGKQPHDARCPSVISKAYLTCMHEATRRAQILQITLITRIPAIVNDSGREGNAQRRRHSCQATTPFHSPMAKRFHSRQHAPRAGRGRAARCWASTLRRAACQRRTCQSQTRWRSAWIDQGRSQCQPSTCGSARGRPPKSAHTRHSEDNGQKVRISQRAAIQPHQNAQNKEKYQ